MPAGRLETSHIACPLTAWTALAVQPVRGVPSTSNATSPPSGAGATVAVKVTLSPGAEGLPLLTRPVVVALPSAVTALDGAEANPGPASLVALTAKV